MSTAVFVTATDTNVGKTVFSALLLSHLRQRGHSANYWKPLQTGSDSDTLTVSQLSGTPDETFPAPVFESPHALAPWQAAMLEGRSIDIATLGSQWKEMRHRSLPWIIEGAGGMMVPLTPRFLVRDLIRLFQVPLILVSSSRLGCINHTCLSVEAAEKSGLKILGIALMGNENESLEDCLKTLTGVERIVRIPHFQNVDSQSLREFASSPALEVLAQPLITKGDP